MLSDEVGLVVVSNGTCGWDGVPRVRFTLMAWTMSTCACRAARSFTSTAPLIPSSSIPCHGVKVLSTTNRLFLPSSLHVLTNIPFFSLMSHVTEFS
ncbi:unnamed protein product [Closterium sp. Yama58-4]|nr:unnamed protein product [Closterium sp. Yama58-4]